MENSYLLTYLLLIPLAGSLLVLLINKKNESLIKWGALFISLTAFLVSLIIYFRFDAGNGGFQFIEKVLWIKSAGISYHIGVDGISLLLVLLTTFLTPLTLLSTWKSVTKKIKEFTFFMLLLEVGMLGVFISLDMFLFYIFWEAMLIPLYGLGYSRTHFI